MSLLAILNDAALLNAFQRKCLIWNVLYTTQLDQTETTGTKGLNDFYIAKCAFGHLFVLFARRFVLRLVVNCGCLLIIRYLADQIDKCSSIQSVASGLSNGIDIGVTSLFLKRL